MCFAAVLIQPYSLARLQQRPAANAMHQQAVAVAAGAMQVALGELGPGAGRAAQARLQPATATAAIALPAPWCKHH